jgi:hypothetical protein
MDMQLKVGEQRLVVCGIGDNGVSLSSALLCRLIMRANKFIPRRRLSLRRDLLNLPLVAACLESKQGSGGFEPWTCST